MHTSTRRAVTYSSAFTIPLLVTYVVAWLSLPSFVFEHLVVLLVIAVAIPWGLGPAVVAAVVSVLADNLLLREPIGRPAISGYRDVIDLALFATVAVVVSGLMRRAHTARRVAQEAAQRERRAHDQLDHLIATIAHDLSTPLSVLRNTVALARSPRGAHIEWQLLIERLDMASARATSLLRMLSDARALHVDGLEMTLATHDLAAVVRPIVTMMDRTSERHPLVLSLPDYPVMIHADAERIGCVVQNLISNAIKYSPAGGPVEVSVEVASASAVLRVRDHGIGILPDALPHIFTRAYRGPGVEAYAPGCGLGLSIAAEVVQRHHGSIEASPAEGRGTVFRVRLPLRPGASPPAPIADLIERELASVPSSNQSR